MRVVARRFFKMIFDKRKLALGKEPLQTVDIGLSNNEYRINVGKSTTYAFMYTGKLVERYEFETMVSSVPGRGVRYILMVRLIAHMAVNSTHTLVIRYS